MNKKPIWDIKSGKRYLNEEIHELKEYLRRNNPSKDSDRDGIPNAFDIHNIKRKIKIVRR